MEPIRVGLAGLSPMLRDLATGIVAEQPDMVVVGTYARCEEWQSALQKLPDILVVSISDTDLPPACEELMTEQPRLRVIAVAGDARRAYMYELQPRRIPLGEVSPQGLVHAIRTAARRGASEGPTASVGEGWSR